MSAFRITIETDNAAFQGNDAAEVEVARILRKLADDIKERGADYYLQGSTLTDFNGNSIGTVRYRA